MDIAFLRRAERLLDRDTPAPLDHALLLAALSARRSGPGGEAGDGAIGEPLVELLLSGTAWRRAAAAQRGCFNRAEAGRHRNAA